MSETENIPHLEGVVNVMRSKQPLLFLHHVQERALCLLCLWAECAQFIQSNEKG
jgi:hypothetical protein